jgi:hypothetical protein
MLFTTHWGVPMPGMPFHLEKGHALMAVENLLNDPAHRNVLITAFDGLRSGAPLGDVFAGITAHAPQLDAYGQNPAVTGAGGLGAFVSGAWFGQPTGTSPESYWLDFEGAVDEVVRETLLFAMEMAGPDVDRTEPLPPEPFARTIELFWHCGQRWFESWLTWESPASPITVLFATPPHVAGDVLPSVTSAPPGQATAVTAATADPDRDMILVTEDDHTERRVPALTFWPTGKFSLPLPTIGSTWDGSGEVGAWSIHADSGGVRPPTTFA